jgi:hypothetical protein
VIGKTLVELLEPLIGKTGVVIVRSRSGSKWLLTDNENPLVSVKVSEDGLVEATTKLGWDVLEPEGVEAVGWLAKDGERAGTYL